MPDPDVSHHAEPATALLADLGLEIEPLLSRFHVTEGEAEDLLREVLVLLPYCWERVDSRELWLLAVIKRACLRRLRRRVSRSASS